MVKGWTFFQEDFGFDWKFLKGLMMQGKVREEQRCLPGLVGGVGLQNFSVDGA